MDGDLHRCPVSRPRNVLDIATGTGIWAIQFAKLHPESTVVGTDLSLIQPTDNVPPNVSFVKEDSERDEWVFPEPFDFVYLRFVLSCFDDHRVVMRKAFESLNPGGWIELLDPTFELLCTDGTTEGTGIKRWSDLILQSGPVVGRDFLVAKNYKQWLLDLGFVDVVEEVLPVPSKLTVLPTSWSDHIYASVYVLDRDETLETDSHVTIVNNWPSDPKFKDVGRWEMMNAEKGVRGIAVSATSLLLFLTTQLAHFQFSRMSYETSRILLTRFTRSGSCSAVSASSHKRSRILLGAPRETSETLASTDSSQCEHGISFLLPMPCLFSC